MTNVEINKSIKLSEHFTLGELTVTSVKTADKNIPSHVAIENLKRLCKWLEHLRAQYNLLYDDGSHPIVINSGYRSEEVNRKVGGAPNGWRCAKFKSSDGVCGGYPGVWDRAGDEVCGDPAELCG